MNGGKVGKSKCNSLLQVDALPCCWNRISWWFSIEMFRQNRPDTGNCLSAIHTDIPLACSPVVVLASFEPAPSWQMLRQTSARCWEKAVDDCFPASSSATSLKQFLALIAISWHSPHKICWSIYRVSNFFLLTASALFLQWSSVKNVKTVSNEQQIQLIPKRLGSGAFQPFKPVEPDRTDEAGLKFQSRSKQ